MKLDTPHMSSTGTCLYHQEDGNPLVIRVVQVGAVKLASGAGALEGGKAFNICIPKDV